jgi:hypothetical protein
MRYVLIKAIAWRDFYTHVLAAFPRVSMGRPFNEKFADVQWETNEEHLQAWKEGRTGVPIVDAAMRQCMTMGKASLCAYHMISASTSNLSRLDAQSDEDGGCYVFDQGPYDRLEIGRKSLSFHLMAIHRFELMVDDSISWKTS